ncbi:MAG: T9SS type A sorting domain-containing protein, partial [Bacteroidetes bacterium]
MRIANNTSMKTRILFFLGLLLTGLSVQAQVYSFSQSTATYADLNNPLILLNDTQTGTGAILMNGNFMTYNEALDSILWISQNPYLSNTTNAGNLVVMGGIEADMQQGKSEVSVLIEGNSGSQILKIQYKNMATALDTGANLNVQIWLYEAEQKIELRFGPGMSNELFTCGLMLLSPDNKTAYDYLLLGGDPSSPVVNDGTQTKLSAWPAEGTVYTFKLEPNSVSTIGENELNVYPNPSAGSFQIEGADITDVKAFDAMGQEVKVKKNENNYSLSEPKVGVYHLLVVTKNGGIRSKRITV